LLDHADEAPLANIKIESQSWPEKLFLSRGYVPQHVPIVIELFSSYCAAHLVESYRKESKISDKIGGDILFIKFDQNLVEFMTSSVGQFAYFKILNIFGTKGNL